MTVPHVFELAGLPRTKADELRLPAVETIDGLEQLLLQGRKVEDAVATVIERHLDACDWPQMCGLMHSSQWADWRPLAALWRLWATDAEFPVDFGWRIPDEVEAYGGSEAVIRSEAAREFTEFLGNGRQLSDVETPLRDRNDCIDWRGSWVGEHLADNALLEYWRGTHLLRKARATGARQRAIEALRAKVRPLEPLAVDYARRALIDPLNAALEAALDS